MTLASVRISLVVALVVTVCSAVVPVHAATSHGRQAAANAALFGLWTDNKTAHGIVEYEFDDAKAARVTKAAIRAAIGKGADVNARADGGVTVLMFAAQANSVSNIQVLVGCGANVNASDSGGSTPLLCAALAGNADCVKYLLSKGASVKPKNAIGQTALGLAAAAGSPDCVRALLAAGSQVDTPDDIGETPLVFAVGATDIAIFKASLDSQGHEVPNLSADSPHLLAAAEPAIMCIKLLIAAGANVNGKDIGGETVLQKTTNPRVIAVLKAAGAK